MDVSGRLIQDLLHLRASPSQLVFLFVRQGRREGNMESLGQSDAISENTRAVIFEELKATHRWRGPQGKADTVVADRSGSTAAEDGEVSWKSSADAATKVRRCTLKMSRRAKMEIPAYTLGSHKSEA